MIPPFKKPLVLGGFIIFAYSPLFINAGFGDVCATQPVISLFQVGTYWLKRHLRLMQTQCHCCYFLPAI
jgi:hypothetical protein